ncbi:hypothetical protein DCS_03910 [Drechmeria coniospora]|uniref:Uncharacterized protein n=1 Tax=Drechmeria coniospora TaxID=98403 RepID=A0A151GIJ1_DRECN|nr:hypothetical protein DCS_03910 [Drechmeria coniospora]KYK56904.1 hypothetical protein DCS_03910 [Drechmeria coniospora]
MPPDARARGQPGRGQRVLLAQRPKTYQGHRNEKFAVGGCFATLEGEPFIASASEDGTIVLWDVKSKEVLQRIDGHEGVCFWVDIHGETMASAGEDNTVRVYRHASSAAAKPTAETATTQAGERAPSSVLPVRQQQETVA